jgi:benzoate membrane transport protein
MIGREKMKNIEKGYGCKNFFRDFFKQVSIKTIFSGLISAIFAWTAVVVFYSVAKSNGVDKWIVDYWMTGELVVGGLLGILIACYYRKPIAVAWSFTGSVVFIIAIANFSLREALLGAFMSGVLLVILALTGFIKKIMNFLPTSVVMGMIGGCFLSYGLNIVKPLADSPLLVVLVVLTYLIFSKLIPKIPAVVAAMIVGGVYLAFTGFVFPSFEAQIMLPHLILPAVTKNIVQIFISVSIPITVLVLGAENAQAYGVLLEQDYNPPINGMTLLSGIGGMISGFIYCANINIAGPMTAICSSPDCGEKDRRWTGSVVLGFLWIVVGLFYASLADFFLKFPGQFVSMISGIAVLGVIVGALKSAFVEEKYRTSAVFAFLVAAAGVKLLGIGSPFWSLVFGGVIYTLFEGGLSRKDDQAAIEAG